MTKLMKKLTVGNPLANFHLWDDLAEYDSIQTDEELAAFYHKMLSKYEKFPLRIRFLFAMIGFSIGINLESKIPQQL